MKRWILISTCIGSSVSSFLTYVLIQSAFKRPPFKTTTITAISALFSEHLPDVHLSDLIFPPGLPGRASSKEFACKSKTNRFDPWVGNFSWKRKWHPTPVFLQKNSMDRGAWWATAHRAAKSGKRLSVWAAAADLPSLPPCLPALAPSLPPSLAPALPASLPCYLRHKS